MRFARSNNDEKKVSRFDGRFFPIERSTLFASSSSSSSSENDADDDTNNDTNDTDDVEGKKTSSSSFGRDACDAFFSRRAIR